MLKNRIDFLAPLRFIRYGRMSSDQQNPRSPDQQFDTIDEVIRRRNLPWTAVGDYRDNGVSGRYIRSRPDFQRMLDDIRSKRIETDLILVDTLERFGRADRIPEIRRNLYQKYGVLVLTADSNFADPTTVAGSALAFVESMRATEDNRVKAHNVLRGKRDAVRQKRWPGGKAPFGYRLESVFKDVNGRQELDYCRLVPDPLTAWIIRLLFEKARETGWGATRLAQFLNQHSEVIADLKPFDGTNVWYWLRCSTYIGIYVWEKSNTGVIDDRRVNQPTPDEERIVVEDFCEPLVPRDVWDAVQELRLARAAARPSRRRKNVRPEKAIAPVSRGLVMTYPLTGLVRCGACGRSMIPASSSAYTSVAGEVRRYVAYRCPATASGGCANKTSVPENWLRQVTTQTLLARLGLVRGDASGSGNEVLEELLVLVNQALRRYVAERPSNADACRAELATLAQAISGWTQSLGRPDLPEPVRRELERRWAEAAARQLDLERELRDEERLRQSESVAVDFDEVRQRLESLHTSLSGENATLANLQLSLHVDRIECFADGQVRMRICKLGMLPDVASLIDQFAQPIARLDDETPRQRRRGRLALEDDLDENFEDKMHFALDPDRFADLPDEWFWTDEYSIPQRLSWAESHAKEVADYRLATRLPMDKTAEHFGVTIPTIRAALRIAKDEFGIDAMGKELSLPTRPNWPRDNAQAVAAFLARPGVKRKDAAAHFQKSLTWIKRALDLAQELLQEPDGAERRPDGDAA